MGFSVSASTVVIALAVFVAFGSFYTASSNGYERVTAAQETAFGERLDQQNTEIGITNATEVEEPPAGITGNYVHVEVENNGTTTLSVNATDVIIDNEYATTFRTRTVEGNGETDLWQPGETLTVEVEGSILRIVDPPERVKVVTGPGVADAEAIQ